MNSFVKQFVEFFKDSMSDIVLLQQAVVFTFTQSRYSVVFHRQIPSAKSSENIGIIENNFVIFLG